MKDEEWRDLYDEGFDLYQVSSFGRIRNAETGRVLKVTPTMLGVAKIGLLRDDRRQHTVSVAPLVARAFLGPHPKQVFSTPINKDGDRMNNRVDNLEWRPLWFAQQYHRQFGLPYRGYIIPLVDVDTGEEFPEAWPIAIKYGVLLKDITKAVDNRVHVFPTTKIFRFK